MDSFRVKCESKMPFREQQWKLLKTFLGGGAVPPSLFLYGHTGTGKTHVTLTVMELLQLNFVRINCVEFDSLPLIASAIAAKLTACYLSNEPRKKCNTVMDLVHLMQKISSTEQHISPFIIILERCEKLRNLPPTALPALMKLQKLSGMNVCVIMISDIIWERYFNKLWYMTPIKIFFPQYTKDQVCEIISLETPADISRSIFVQCVKLVVSLMWRFCNNLNELNFVMNHHLPQIREANTTNMTEIYKTLQSDFKASIYNLHLRGDIKTKSIEKEAVIATTNISGLELPYYAKYLLIAAFLASYNAPKHDKRLFMKFHGKERKKLPSKRRVVKMSSLLVGPKQFAFERLIAIFTAIVDDKCAITTSLCAQLTTLVNLKLITKVGCSGLNDPKYACAIGLDFVSQIGKEVNFLVSKYIMQDN